VCVYGGEFLEGEGEWRRLWWGYIVGRLHILIWNRTKKPLSIALSRAGKGLRGRDNGGNLTNVQYKSNQHCHYEAPLHNKYILKKVYEKQKYSTIN
jgi:hypothetical protein